METIAQKELRSQDLLVKLEQEDIEQYVERTDPEEFGKRSVEGLEKVSESLWKRPLVVSSISSLGHWNMREAQEEKMFAMGIALGILGLSMG